MNSIKARLKSKTYYLGLFVLCLTFTQDNFGLVSQYLGEYSNLVNYTIGVLILIMRELTVEPVSKKIKDPNVF